MSLLSICNIRLSAEQIRGIESELATSLIVAVPTHEFKEISDFYKLNFLSESESESISALIKLQNSNQLLERSIE